MLASAKLYAFDAMLDGAELVVLPRASSLSVMARVSGPRFAIWAMPPALSAPSLNITIAPNGGKEFGPRHLDFHPTKPWMYVSIETQNKMYTYKMEAGRINPEIAFRAETLAGPLPRPHQGREPLHRLHVVIKDVRVGAGDRPQARSSRSHAVADRSSRMRANG